MAETAITKSTQQGVQQGAFLVSPQQALTQLENIRAVIKEVMKKDEHYGVIPGTRKPSLLKPGAELLNNMYGYFPAEVEILEKTEQWDAPNFPLFRYIIRVALKNTAGTTIAVGIGECNSFEEKYRYRKSSRSCPACGKETIIKGKAEYGGGWLCWKNKGGCGAKYGDNDPALKAASDKVENDQIHSQINTILKMAKKRAYIDATLSATRTSGIFTQDVEDMPGLADVQEAAFIEVKNDDPFEGALDRSPYERLESSLTAVANTGDATSLEGWAKIHKPELDSLPDHEKKTLRRAYTNALKTIKKPGHGKEELTESPDGESKL